VEEEKEEKENEEEEKVGSKRKGTYNNSKLKAWLENIPHRPV
jgi:hypothetical protein